MTVLAMAALRRRQMEVLFRQRMGPRGRGRPTPTGPRKFPLENGRKLRENVISPCSPVHLCTLVVGRRVRILLVETFLLSFLT